MTSTVEAWKHAESPPSPPHPTPRVGRILGDGEGWVNDYKRFCATEVAMGTAVGTFRV